MASQYYGLRGNLVKDYQQKLNSLGANLKVDGIWGRKTEKAYNLFMEEFNDLLYGREEEEEVVQQLPEAEKFEYTPRTEEQLRQYAENLYGATYDQKLYHAEKSAAGQAKAKQAMIDALLPLYEQQLSNLAREYQAGREYLSNQALSRGLGRSSYLTDQLAGSLNQQRAEASLLTQQMNSRQAALQDEIAQLYSDLEQERSQISAQREQALIQAMESGRQQDQQMQFEALKYNNSLIQDAREQAEKTRQFEEELKLKRAAALK